jgi:hypothetical protein
VPPRSRRISAIKTHPTGTRAGPDLERLSMDQQSRGGARIDKVLALLDSDQAGEVQAAARALRRLLTREARPATPPDELEACLAYAVDAIVQLTRDIEGLRRDNARLRAGRERDSTAGAGVLRWCGLAA